MGPAVTRKKSSGIFMGKGYKGGERRGMVPVQQVGTETGGEQAPVLPARSCEVEPHPVFWGKEVRSRTDSGHRCRGGCRLWRQGRAVTSSVTYQLGGFGKTLPNFEAGFPVCKQAAAAPPGAGCVGKPFPPDLVASRTRVVARGRSTESRRGWILTWSG